jgi:hypothetical protein
MSKKVISRDPVSRRTAKFPYLCTIVLAVVYSAISILQQLDPEATKTLLLMGAIFLMTATACAIPKCGTWAIIAGVLCIMGPTVFTSAWGGEIGYMISYLSFILWGMCATIGMYILKLQNANIKCIENCLAKNSP